MSIYLFFCLPRLRSPRTSDFIILLNDGRELSNRKWVFISWKNGKQMLSVITGGQKKRIMNKTRAMLKESFLYGKRQRRVFREDVHNERKKSEIQRHK